MPIKAGWRDAFLSLWYFSRNSKHYSQLSTTTSLASLLQCLHFRSSRPDLFFGKGVLKNFAKFISFLRQRILLWILWHFKKHFFRRTPPVAASGICTNKSAAEAWICLVSFYGGAKDFISTCVFFRRITFFIKIQIFWHRIFSIFQKQPPEVFCKKGVLKNFAKFTGKQLCQILTFNKVAGPRSQTCNFIKRETLAQVFSVNFVKLLKAPFLQNSSGRLLLIFLLDHNLIPEKRLYI